MSGFLARRDLAVHQSEGEICLYFYDKDNNYQDDENENGCDGNGMVGNVTMAGHGKRLLLNVVAVCVCVCAIGIAKLGAGISHGSRHLSSYT